MMAEIKEVYGQNFCEESQQSKIDYLISQIANNVAHRQFNFRLTDPISLWDNKSSLKPQTIITLSNKVKQINPKMQLRYLNSQSKQINMLPRLVVGAPVEYFMLIDQEYGRAYFLYLTHNEINAY